MALMEGFTEKEVAVARAKATLQKKETKAYEAMEEHGLNSEEAAEAIAAYDRILPKAAQMVRQKALPPTA